LFRSVSLDGRLPVLEDYLLVSSRLPFFWTSRRSPRVKLEQQQIQIGRLSRLLTAGILLVALVCAQQASAASVSSSPYTAPTAHDCKCGMKCHRGSCCCGFNNPESGPPTPKPTSGSEQGIGRPCSMTSAPCGDSALPGATTDRPVSNCATLAMPGQLRSDTVGMLLPFSPPNLVPPPIPSRLHRPPEHLGCA
jgi:hypothetical protein